MKFKIAVGAVILSVIGLGVSSAAIPDSTTGVITACRSSIGQLKVIDKQAGASCSVYGETEMSWNHTGPAGATGATGPQGPAGVAGSSGITGYEIVYQATSNTIIPAWEWFSWVVPCPTGKRPLGGGGSTTTSGSENQGVDAIVQSIPDTYGWNIRISPWSSERTIYHIVGYAICAYVS